MAPRTAEDLEVELTGVKLRLENSIENWKHNRRQTVKVLRELAEEIQTDEDNSRPFIGFDRRQTHRFGRRRRCVFHVRRFADLDHRRRGHCRGRREYDFGNENRERSLAFAQHRACRGRSADRSRRVSSNSGPNR